MASVRHRAAGSKSILLQVSSESICSPDGRSINLAALGSLADQSDLLAIRGHTIHVLASGPNADKVKGALSAMLGLKEGGGHVTVSAWPSSSSDGATLATQAATVAATLATQAAMEHKADLIVLLDQHQGILSSTLKPIHTFDPSAASNLTDDQRDLSGAAWGLSQESSRPLIIASSTEKDVLVRIIAGEEVGTLFDPPSLEELKRQVEASSLHTGSMTSGDKPLGSKASNSRDMAVRARAASRTLQTLTSAERSSMLERVADALLLHQGEILAENEKDVLESTGKVADSLLQRLILKGSKLQLLAEGIRAIARQEEPIGRLISRTEVAEGLVLDKITSPIGVLLIIFEARPDALPQIASLAFRSGNGLLLKGGKEATRSNTILHRVITEAIGPIGPDLISLVQTREEIGDLLLLDDVIDLVIPRGGNALVSHIQRTTRIPVLGHADGVCHIYVDAKANLDMAIKIAVDSKVDYPAACNAAEKILVHSSWVERGGLSAIVKALEDSGVKVHSGGGLVAELLPDAPLAPAPRHEYSSLDCTVEVVRDMEEAIAHIHAHGSSHTDCIVTDDLSTAECFLRTVDSACVFHNASTRFADGFRFGLGAEVGISTGRIHARGPVGVEGLLTTRWIMRGEGQRVAKDQGVVYTHRKL